MSHRFGIIGCGHVAARHAVQILSRGILVGVCDPDPEKARHFAGRYSSVPYHTAQDMLEQTKPDLVVICSPNGLHAEHISLALGAGAHVLTEKPLCLSLRDGHQLIEAAARANRKLFVVKQNRFNAPVRKLKTLIEQNALGHISSFQVNCFWNRAPAYYHNNWRGKLALDGGTLFTQFSHFIDLLYWYLGTIESVAGWRANVQHEGIIEFEDAGAASLLMRNGTIGTLNYHINAHNANIEGSIALFGEKGSVKVGGEYLEHFEFFSVEGHEVPVFPGRIAGEKNFANLSLLYDELEKALDGDAEYELVEGKEALQSLIMIHQIYDSSPFLESRIGR